LRPLGPAPYNQNTSGPGVRTPELDPSMNPLTTPETLWYKHLEAIRDSWPEVRRGDTEALHQARVVSRRIREVLPVVAAGGERDRVRRLSRGVRRITRALGPMRALDVGLAALSEFDAAMPDRRAGLALLRRSLLTSRRRLRRRVSADLIRIDIEKLIRKLARLAVEAAPTGPGQERARVSVLAARTLKRAAGLRDAVEAAGALYVPDRLHAVRIAAKKLRYVLEVSERAGAPLTGSLIPPLKNIQATLGRAHDLQGLVDLGRRLQASPRGAAGEGDLASVLDSIEHECRRLHAEFVARRDELIQLCDAARTAAAGRLAMGRPGAAGGNRG
jgi:CHAD domain-containing protein